MKKSIEKFKQTLKDHPEITKQAGEKRSETFKNNPEIVKQSTEKLKQTLKNNPEIQKRATEKFKRTLKNNPGIMKKSLEKRRQTYRNNPEILKQAGEKRSETFKNNPEILEKSHDKAYTTMKKKGFVSKEEQQMIQLLKDKYGENDVIEQYRDDRYTKTNSNYKYSCDCYIRSLDLFIEYNGSRFHPKESDKPKLLQEIENFKLKYPDKSIKQCQASTLLDTIENDKIKQQVTKDSRLNYLIVTDGFKELYDNKVL